MEPLLCVAMELERCREIEDAEQVMNGLMLTVAKIKTRRLSVSRAGCAPGFATNGVVLKAARAFELVVANRRNKVRQGNRGAR